MKRTLIFVNLGLISLILVGVILHFLSVRYFETLRTYSGADLSSLSTREVKHLQCRISKLCPERSDDEITSYQLKQIWEIADSGSPLIVILETFGVELVPGTSTIRITVFDSTDKMLSESTLTTGYRCYLNTARMLQQDEKSPPILILETVGPIGGDDCDHQDYSYVKGRWSSNQ
jgi:hypothetical protein